MTSTRPQRIEAIARELEDPTRCEWKEVRSASGSISLMKDSKLGFWSYVPGADDETPWCVDAGAGWLMECLIRAKWDVKVDCLVGRGPSGKDVEYSVEVCGWKGQHKDLPEAVLAAAERAINNWKETK